MTRWKYSERVIFNLQHNLTKTGVSVCSCAITCLHRLAETLVSGLSAFGDMCWRSFMWNTLPRRLCWNAIYQYELLCMHRTSCIATVHYNLDGKLSANIVCSDLALWSIVEKEGRSVKSAVHSLIFSKVGAMQKIASPTIFFCWNQMFQPRSEMNGTGAVHMIAIHRA